MRRPGAVLALVALATAALGACSSGTTTAITDPPLCKVGDGDATNEVVLMAQSVPTAAWIPCIRAALPLGWDFHHLEAVDGQARFWLDSDRDGQRSVEIRLTATCDTAGSTRIASDHEGMQRWERVGRMSPTYVGQRFYVFDGGCVTVVFRLQGNSPAEALALASQVLGAVSRADLEAQVREDSNGRLSLDPEE